MSAWERASILLRDNGHNICKCVVLVAAAAVDPSGGAINTIATAIQAITKAISPRQESGGTAAGSGSTPGTSAYQTIEDRMILTYNFIDGSTGTYEIPAPKTAMFIAGTDLVDATNASVIALNGWLADNACSPFAETGVFEKGIRSRKKQMKR
jgi:hypothetical protein